MDKDDAGQYIRMAESFGYLARLPYTFRVLSPALAGIALGGSIRGFIAITLVSLVCAGAALFLLQRILGLSRTSSGAGMALFLVSGGSTRLLTTPTYVDALTYATEAIGLALILLVKPIGLAALVSVAVANRETAGLLLPAAYGSAAWRHRGVRTFLWPAIACGTVGLAIVILKLGLTSAPWSQLAPNSRTFDQRPPGLTELFDLYSTFGALWPLAAIYLPGPRALRGPGAVFAALIALQLVVSRGDEGRNLSHVFPVLIPIAMLAVEEASRRPNHRLLVGILVIAVAAGMVNARWVWIPDPTIRYVLVGVGSVVATALGIWLRVSERSGPPSAPARHPWATPP
ncbi:MAG: hypothetical protein U0821_07395 [Chloroflexota bacterium]